MKRLILLVCFASLFLEIYSQDQVTNGLLKSRNDIGIWSNVGICELSRHNDQTGVVAAHGKAVLSYGLSYITTISPKLKLETGISYTKYSIINHVIAGISLDFYATEYFQIISIPILLRYYFPKEYFLSGGTILDLGFERNGWDISDSQNGFALSIGAGKEISFSKFTLSIATNFDLHAAIPFSGDLSQQKFFVPGLKIGLNYKIN
jgi:hypothetical protein